MDLFSSFKFFDPYISTKIINGLPVIEIIEIKCSVLCTILVSFPNKISLGHL